MGMHITIPFWWMGTCLLEKFVNFANFVNLLTKRISCTISLFGWFLYCFSIKATFRFNLEYFHLLFLREPSSLFTRLHSPVDAFVFSFCFSICSRETNYCSSCCRRLTSIEIFNDPLYSLMIADRNSIEPVIFVLIEYKMLAVDIFGYIEIQYTRVICMWEYLLES